ncbi:MAG: sulfotransferase, partial [Mesorhizobium sp.]
AQCLGAVWDFLGVPALEPSDNAILQRQETRPLDQTVENFDELRIHFARGPYSRFFDLGDSMRSYA